MYRHAGCIGPYVKAATNNLRNSQFRLVGKNGDLHIQEVNHESRTEL